MTSYQKLKEKNKTLNEVIELLIMNPDGVEALSIKFNFRLHRDFEDAIMFGNPTMPNSDKNPEPSVATKAQ